jgi:hypothetical protein
MKKEICSPAEHPVLERFYPEISWTIRDMSGKLLQFDAYNNLVDNSKWSEYFRHITPQERFDEFYKREQAKGEKNQKPESYVPRCVSSGEVYATLNTSVVFKVEELIYPGGEAIPVADKWIYAVHTGTSKILAEIFSVDGSEMYCRYNPTFRGNVSEPAPDVRVYEGKIKLPMIQASDVGTDIGFFISPFRFTKEAADYLVGDNKRLKESVVCAVRVDCESLYAAVPDPNQWTEDAHGRFFAPLLNYWQEYVLTPERQARVFIASALEGAIEGGQIRGIQEKLSLKKGEPKKFLSRYRQDEEKLRVNAEVAAVYLYNCVGSPEHYIVNLAGIHADAETLGYETMHWAVVSDRLVETAQGRIFAQKLSEDNLEHLPIKFFFGEETNQGIAQQLGEMFPNTRYGFQAAVAMVGEWSPTQVGKAVEGDKYRKLINALNHLGLKDGGKAFAPKAFKKMFKKNQKITKLMYSNLTQMAKESDEFLTFKPTTLTSGATKQEARLIEQLAEKIENLEMTQRVKITAHTPSFTTRTAQRMAGVYEKSFKSVRLPLEFIIEAINTINSVGEFLDNKDPKQTIAKLIPTVGDALDFLSVLGAPTTQYFENKAAFYGAQAAEYSAVAANAGNNLQGQVAGAMSQNAKILQESAAVWGTRMKIGFGIVGMIAGACQAYDEYNKTIEGWEKREYGIAVGHGIAAAGAALTVIGGGITLAATLTSSAATAAVLGPVGLVVTVVGTVLIFAGNIIAAVLTPNAFEQFARYCFLGDDNDINTTVQLDWAENPLPTKDIIAECRELMRILCSFQLELEETHLEYHRPSAETPYRYVVESLATHVKIRPGYLTDNVQMDIVVEEVFGNNGTSEALTTELRILPHSDKIAVVRGQMEFQDDGNTVERDENGFIRLIRLNIKPKALSSKSQGRVDNFANYHLARKPSACRVKVRAGMNTEGVYIPSRYEYVQIETTEQELQKKINERIYHPSYRTPSFQVIGKDGKPVQMKRGPENKMVSSLDKSARSQ